MARRLGFVNTAYVRRESGGRSGAVCNAEKDSRDNGVNKSTNRRVTASNLNAEILKSTEKQQAILRYMSVRDRLEYIDSKGNLTPTFYKAVALTIFIYGCLILGGFNLVKGLFIFGARIASG
mmetsp:Transcript_10289/g.31457  ORF Transcript_10289/g.31457 Transcript_10289/m.31457 type:complete len:122 (+) Transcript_10289:217-582(+)